MSAVFGLLLITFAVLLFGGALVASRRRGAPGWLGESVAAPAIVITTIGLFVMGIGLTVQFAVSYGREPLGWVESALIGGMLVVVSVAFGAIGRLLRAPNAVSGTKEFAGNIPATQRSSGVSRFSGASTPLDPAPPKAPSSDGRSPGKRAA